MRAGIALLLTVCSLPAMAYEAMYEATEPGGIEVKQIPELKAMQAAGRGSYFETDDGVFMKLFRYIDRNDVAMTVPVESDIETNRMRFFVGTADGSRALTNSDAVMLVARPARHVASIGLRGSYTKENYEAGLRRLGRWLEEHQQAWRTNGAPYAVYWNSPFVPGFLKKSEIHIPVVAVGTTAAPATAGSAQPALGW